MRKLLKVAMLGALAFSVQAAPRRANAVVESKTVEGGEGVHAIMVAVDLFDPKTLRPFAVEIVAAVKKQWAKSPPGTRHLLITVIGDGVTAAQVKAAWKEAAAKDSALQSYMSQMLIADIVHAGTTGSDSDQVSLLN